MTHTKILKWQSQKFENIHFQYISTYNKEQYKPLKTTKC